jgi:deazaflavin-dependent oxidoreductase (nitroreductase family)
MHDRRRPLRPLPHRAERCLGSRRPTKPPGRVRADGVHKDVTLADHTLDDQIDAAYRAKYQPNAARPSRRCRPPRRVRQPSSSSRVREPDSTSWPARCAHESFLYLTTIGRRSGRPHRIEIWFAGHRARLYLLSGGRERADWVRNLQATPRVTVELGGETHVGVAHVLEAGAADDQLARQLLLAKYADSEDDLDEWGRSSLPVVIEFPADADEPASSCAEHTRGSGGESTGDMA